MALEGKTLQHWPCFGPLKRCWEEALNKWSNEFGVKEPIRKARFVEKLCEFWHKGLSPENVIAGFSCTGIYPIDSTKYPRHRLDARLVKRYDAWVKAGKPDDINADDLATTATSTPQKLTAHSKRAESTPTAIPTTTATEEIPINVTPIGNVECHCRNCEDLGPIPMPAPDERNGSQSGPCYQRPKQRQTKVLTTISGES